MRHLLYVVGLVCMPTFRDEGEMQLARRSRKRSRHEPDLGPK